MKSTEKSTQAAILDYLKLRGIFHYRQNTGAFSTSSPITGNSRFVRFGFPGASDIVAVWKGQYVAIEVKDVKGRLNENQERFKEALEYAGGVYVLARSLDDVTELFD